MKNTYTYPTEYFLREGRENLESCLNAALESAAAHSAEKVVIFTSAGLGVRKALEAIDSNERYANLKIIAVTFPSNTTLPAGSPQDHLISPETAASLTNRGIPIVRAHLPFAPVKAHHEGHGLLGQDFSLLGNALNMFCGSMSLCVQAVLLACDAGHIELGEHVVAMTSDTAILARAAGTSRLLTDLIIREIICKPVLLTISKSEKLEDETATESAQPEEVSIPILDLEASSD
ncbi:hypothetical protein [Terriglobus saanensis]|uniref:Pyruvate kinase C-terminal domain-containing protein n=1 Tax=Terriglobus saanensis (strain ATCC BAA-1853 / DSM 23119 / SP1PR4) TaxID=401053 RepID=E8UYA6_TERSS|nr:hypothetical protein [Terriglobus saanensis]ADV80916.1 hypothetical protein AciPR4_0075 [Terriglobus saanensis SP1PR4]